MSGVQNKKKQPGAWNSCLQPYLKEIFDLYFKQKKSTRFIQKYLLENKKLDISYASIWRFITVRQNRKDPRRKDPHRMSKTALANLRAVTAEAAPAQEPDQGKINLPVKAEKHGYIVPEKTPEQIAAQEKLERIEKMSGGQFYDLVKSEGAAQDKEQHE